MRALARDTTPPIANAGPDQTVDQNVPVTFNGSGSSDNVGIANYTWTLPDTPGSVRSLYNLGGSTVAFDPVRPYVYVLNGFHVDVVNISSGSVERTLPLDHSPRWPMSLGIAPNGSFLVVGIPTGDRDYYYFGPYQGYVASFDLVNQTKIGEFSVANDIYRVQVSNDGYAIVAGGSGQWAPLQMYNVKDGVAAPNATIIWQFSDIVMHPNSTRIYSVDQYGIYPPAVHRRDFTPSEGFTTWLDWPYWGTYPGYDIWLSPGGDRLLAANGMLLASRDNASQDMQLVVQLPETQIEAAAFDPREGLLAVADGTSLDFFDDRSYASVGQRILPGGPSTLVIRGEDAIATVGSEVVAVRLPRLHRFGVAPTYTFADAGTYEVALTVWDAAGNSATDNVTITVRDTTPPIARAGFDVTVVHGSSVDLDGSNSSDNVGVVDYTWTFNDGGLRTLHGALVSYVFTVTGTYDVTLNVTDASGNWGTDHIVVTVVPDPVRPIANAGPDQTAYLGMRVTLDGSASWDNIRIANYTWRFSDNGPVVLYGVRASRVFETTGTHSIELTVADDDLNIGTATMTVVVSEVALAQVAPYRSGFHVGVPDGWTIRFGFDVQDVGTTDVLASGSLLGHASATFLIYSRGGAFSERDDSLIAAASDSISRIHEKDQTAVVVQSPQVVNTANSRAAVFEVSLASGTSFQVWAVVVSEARGRMWVLIGTSSSGDADLYSVVFHAAIKSFWVEPLSWPQQYPVLFGTLLVGSGTAFGAIGFLGWERARRTRRRTRTRES